MVDNVRHYYKTVAQELTGLWNIILAVTKQLHEHLFLSVRLGFVQATGAH